MMKDATHIAGDGQNNIVWKKKSWVFKMIVYVASIQLCNISVCSDLSSRVDGVKEENLKLKSENQVLGQYIENLMSASSVFQTTDTKGKRKWGEPLRGQGGLPAWWIIQRHLKGFEIKSLMETLKMTVYRCICTRPHWYPSVHMGQARLHKVTEECPTGYIEPHSHK